MAVATAAAEGTTLGLVEVVARLRGLPTTAEAMAGLRARRRVTARTGILDHLADTGWAATRSAAAAWADLVTVAEGAALPLATAVAVAELEATD